MKIAVLAKWRKVYRVKHPCTAFIEVEQTLNGAIGNLVTRREGISVGVGGAWQSKDINYDYSVKLAMFTLTLFLIVFSKYTILCIFK